MIVRLTIEFRVKTAVSDLPDPAIPVTLSQVIQVCFISIGFLFENDVTIG